jgi:hypothetical protein
MLAKLPETTLLDPPAISAPSAPVPTWFHRPPPDGGMLGVHSDAVRQSTRHGGVDGFTLDGIEVPAADAAIQGIHMVSRAPAYRPKRGGDFLMVGHRQGHPRPTATDRRSLHSGYRHIADPSPDEVRCAGR